MNPINPTRYFPAAGSPSPLEPAIPDRCVTDFERRAAQAECNRTRLRGLGQTASDFQHTRWANFDPCMVANMPVCPTNCTDPNIRNTVQGCFLGEPPASYPSFGDPTTRQDHFNRWCGQRGAGLVQNPICVRDTVPRCLPPEFEAVFDYCDDFGFQGHNTQMNSMCYRAIQNGTLDALLDTPICAPQEDPGAPLPPVPDAHAPPADDDGGRRSLAIGGLLLLLVIGGGTAYYVSQRK